MDSKRRKDGNTVTDGIEDSMAEGIEQQAEFEQLVEEHDGDTQKAVDAQQRGEKPKGKPGNVASA